jgi:hypothetical protein
MKTFVLALSLVALGMGPALAGGAAEDSGAAAGGGAAAAKTEADCAAAGGVWNAETSSCAEKPM